MQLLTAVAERHVAHLDHITRNKIQTLQAAEAGGQHALFIKLSNNMGAVLRKMESHEEARCGNQCVGAFASGLAGGRRNSRRHGG